VLTDTSEKVYQEEKAQGNNETWQMVVELTGEKSKHYSGKITEKVIYENLADEYLKTYAASSMLKFRIIHNSET